MVLRSQILIWKSLNLSEFINIRSFFFESKQQPNKAYQKITKSKEHINAMKIVRIFWSDFLCTQTDIPNPLTITTSLVSNSVWKADVKQLKKTRLITNYINPKNQSLRHRQRVPHRNNMRKKRCIYKMRSTRYDLTWTRSIL